MQYNTYIGLSASIYLSIYLPIHLHIMHIHTHTGRELDIVMI